MNNLPELLRSEMDKQRLTYRQVADAAARHGHQIGHSIVYDYAKGKVKKYKQQYLKAFADALGIPLKRLEDAANLPRTYEPFELPEGAEILTPEERRAIQGVVQTMIETRRAVGHSDDTSITEAGEDTPAHDVEDELDERRRAREPHRPRRPGHDPEWDMLYTDQRAATEGDPVMDKGEISDDST